MTFQYQAYLADDSNNNIGGPYGFEILDIPEGTPDLTLSNVMCSASSGDGSYRSPWVIPTDHITLTSTVTNAAGLYNNFVMFGIFPAAGGTSLAILRSDDLTLGPDESTQWVADSDLGVLEDGSTYFLRFYWVKNGTQTAFGDYYYITASGYSAIDGVATDTIEVMVDAATSTLTVVDYSGSVTSVTAYSPTGLELGMARCNTFANSSLSLTLPRGMALLRIVSASGATTVKKVFIP